MLPPSVCQRWYNQPSPLLAELSTRVRTSILSIKLMFGVIERTNLRNIEAKPVLYSATIFDFRSFQNLLVATTILPPPTFSSIRSIHLKYHFGYRLWWEDPDNYVKRPRKEPVWHQAWDIIKGMEELRNVIVDIDANLEYGRLDWETERDLFENLGTVKLKGGGESGLVVRVSWDGEGGEGPDEGLGRGTFRLVRGRVAEW